ncbi:MAG: DUF423 domain-containing protein [Gemmatimonadales bacterium]|jgi:uncharacterized membrane protein YgdD (TMEM256/DUF423 family)
MSRTFFTLGASLAFIGVGAGALGAHAMKDRLAPDLLAAWETGARYGLYHALALLVLALAMSRWPGSLWTTTGWLFVAGSLLFSGSLFALALTGMRWLGAITPIGGVCLLLGWLAAIAAALRNVAGPA